MGASKLRAQARSRCVHPPRQVRKTKTALTLTLTLAVTLTLTLTLNLILTLTLTLTLIPPSQVGRPRRLRRGDDLVGCLTISAQLPHAPAPRRRRHLKPMNHTT